MKKPTSLKAGGFSLVELLVVIAVIAIIAAIAIPNIANITGSATETAAQRNAQNLASVYAAAVAAGWAADNGTPALDGDRDVNIASLTSETGVVVTQGGQDLEFRVDGINDDDLPRIRRYLDANMRYSAVPST
jgi:type IV pilus assembly protein PilA